MKYRLNSFNSLTATLFHSSFVRKSVFYSKIIQYAYNYYGIELYVNVCRGAFRTQSNIYGGASLQQSQERFIVNILLGSKYASGIGFTVEKVYRISIFIWYGQSRLHKFVTAFLFLKLTKKTCWFNFFMTEVSIIIALQMNGLVSVWYVPPPRTSQRRSCNLLSRFLLLLTS